MLFIFFFTMMIEKFIQIILDVERDVIFDSFPQMKNEISWI